MRGLFVLLVLAGCATQEAEIARSNQATLAYMQQPEVRARLDALAAEDRRQVESGRIGLSPREIAIRDRTERNRNAAIICHERGNMAAAQPAYGGRGMAGAINAGLQQGWAGTEIEAACWRAYQATGVMPSY